MAENFVDIKKTTLDDMIDYIEKKAPKEKKWFRSVCFDEKGRYQHLKATRAFYEKFFPDNLPKSKPKILKSDRIKNW